MLARRWLPMKYDVATGTRAIECDGGVVGSGDKAIESFVCAMAAHEVDENMDFPYKHVHTCIYTYSYLW